MSARSAAARRPVRCPGSRPLRVVRKKTRGLIKRAGGRRLAPTALIGVILATSIVVGVLLEQVVLAQSAFKLAQIRKDLAAAEELHQELLLEAARLESPGRIERVARQDLMMVEPVGMPEYIVADIATDKDGGMNASGRLAGGIPTVAEGTAVGLGYEE